MVSPVKNQTDDLADALRYAGLSDGRDFELLFNRFRWKEIQKGLSCEERIADELLEGELSRTLYSRMSLAKKMRVWEGFVGTLRGEQMIMLSTVNVIRFYTRWEVNCGPN